MSDRFDHTLERPLEPKEDEPGDAGLVRRIERIRAVPTALLKP
jgi:hypothetical protein